MNLNEFNLLYDDLLSKINLENKQIYIKGDFNIDLIKSDIHQTTDTFLQNNLSACLKPFITKPSRITPHSKTLIDNIFSNSIEETYFPETLFAQSHITCHNS